MPGLEWHIGDHVQVRGARWTVHETTAWPDCSLLRLTPAGIGRSRSLLTPYDRPQRLNSSRGIRIVRPRRWLHDLRRAGTTLVPYGGAIAAAGASAKLLPHQIEPLLAILRHAATRLLIADAVGLGKTVQAGLILLELSVRSEEFRGIVLVPAGLREQWGQELRDKFGLCPLQADAVWLRASTAERPADVNPWSLPGIYIASIDFAKRAEVLRALEDVTWDLLVLDEAHLASGFERSPRRGACRRLAVEANRSPDRHAGCRRSSRIRGTLRTRRPRRHRAAGRLLQTHACRSAGRHRTTKRPPAGPADTGRTPDARSPGALHTPGLAGVERPRRRTREARGDRASEARPLERRFPRCLGAAPADAPEYCNGARRAAAAPSTRRRGSPERWSR